MPNLITPPELHRTEPVTVARIRLHIPRGEMVTLLPAALEELYGLIADQGIPPAGPWFAHHIELPTTHFHFDACVPVTTVIEPRGRVESGSLPSLPVARTLYRGPYTNLPDAWAEFRAWINTRVETGEFQTAPEVIERYLKNPVDTQDPTQLETELVWPLLPANAKATIN